jgi:hypothetical protein
MEINISDFVVQRVSENSKKEIYARQIVPNISIELLDDIYSSDYWVLLAQTYCFGYATVKRISNTEAQITHFKEANEQIHYHNLGGKILRELEKYYLSNGYTAILTKLPDIPDFSDTINFFQTRGYLKDTKISKNEKLIVLRNEILRITIEKIDDKQKKYEILKSFSSEKLTEEYLNKIIDSTFWIILSNNRYYGYSSLTDYGNNSVRINNFVMDIRLLGTSVPTELYITMQNYCKNKRSLMVRIPSKVNNFSNPLTSFFKKMGFYKYICISSEGEYILLLKNLESKLKPISMTPLPKSALLNIENSLLLNDGEISL